MPKYLVETISVFRIRYVIDCESKEHAMDTVVMTNADEFSQHHVDENVFSCREISDTEIPELFFEDTPYLRSWGPEKAFEYVHTVDYDK